MMRCSAAALARNLFGTVGVTSAQREAMTGYVRRAVADLRGQSAAELLVGRVRFGSPGILGAPPAVRRR